MPLAPGTMVTPNVRLVRVLGRGGMGSVWVADHLSLRTQVAVKFIAPELLARKPEHAWARFKREARAAASIKSPHVVHTYDLGVVEGTPYIVMELLEGESLAVRLDWGPVSPKLAGTVLSQVASALTEAHKLGVVHRDLKPENIFMTTSADELVVKVLDFGIAKQTKVKATTLVTETGAIVGTPAYLSPEQILRSSLVDHRTDIWSLGVVVYEMLTGELPFDPRRPDLLVAISHARFRPPSQVVRGLPREFDPWFSRALCADYESRFSSTREMANAFLQTVDLLFGQASLPPESEEDKPTAKMQRGKRNELAFQSTEVAPVAPVVAKQARGRELAIAKRGSDHVAVRSGNAVDGRLPLREEAPVRAMGRSRRRNPKAVRVPGGRFNPGAIFFFLLGPACAVVLFGFFWSRSGSSAMPSRLSSVRMLIPRPYWWLAGNAVPTWRPGSWVRVDLTTRDLKRNMLPGVGVCEAADTPANCATSDGRGMASLTVPSNREMVLLIGRPDLVAEMVAIETSVTGLSFDLILFSQAEKSAIAETFSVAVDDAKGMVAFRLFGPGGGTASISPASGSGPFYLDSTFTPQPSATRLPPDGAVMFFNVAPGKVTSSYDAPAEANCRVGLSEHGGRAGEAPISLDVEHVTAERVEMLVVENALSVPFSVYCGSTSLGAPPPPAPSNVTF